MTDKLQSLLREEALGLEVPAPPTAEILARGRRARKTRRTRRLLAVAAAVVLVAGGLAGVTRLVGDREGGAPDRVLPATDPPTPTGTHHPAAGPLDVSGSGVGTQPFGTAAQDVLATLIARYGDPDLSVPATTYVRIPGSPGWYEVADDPISLGWRHRVLTVSCWGAFCVVFGGDEPDGLQLRGWELAQYRRWDGTEPTDRATPEVRLSESGITLGDGWPALHRAYPQTVVAGGEGNSLAVRSLPWPGVFDGVGDWRLSGLWDPEHPTQAPAGAVVTRLSGGEGPEPGCC